MFLLLLFSDRAASDALFCPAFSKAGEMFPLGNAQMAALPPENACEASGTHALRVQVGGGAPMPHVLSYFFKSRENVPDRERPSGSAVGKAAKLPARTCKKLPVASFCASETAETGRIANGCEQGDHVSRRKGAIAREACRPDRGKLPACQEVPERERVYSFCFCKKNQKAAGTPSCDLGSNRRSIQYLDRFSGFYQVTNFA